MGGFKIKIILILLIFFAGFAAAIYAMSPVPDNRNRASGGVKQSLAYSVLKSDKFAKSFNTGMHKSLDFTKDAAVRVGKAVKQKACSEKK